MIIEGNELHDTATLGDYNIVEGAVLLVLRRAQLQFINPFLRNLLCAATDMQQTVIAYEHYEDSLDAAVGAHWRVRGGGHGEIG